MGRHNHNMNKQSVQTQPWCMAGGVHCQSAVGQLQPFGLPFPHHPVHKTLSPQTLSPQLQQMLWNSFASGSREFIAAEHLSFPLSLGKSGITEKNMGTVQVGCTTSSKYIFTGDSITDSFICMYIYIHIPQPTWSLRKHFFIPSETLYICVYTLTQLHYPNHI